MCGKSFKRAYHLKRHENIHKKERFFECQTCGKKFKLNHHLKRHELIHQRRGVEREFSCGQCGEKFQTLPALRVHVETAHPKPCTSGMKRKNDSPQKKSNKKQKKASGGIYSS